MGVIIESNLEGIIKLLFHENLLIKKSTSWFILQITENFTRILDRNTLSSLIPTLISCLNADNYIAINMCYSLVNIIKAFGDLNTLKNSSNLFSI